MSLRLLVFGASGQVGFALRKLHGPALRIEALCRDDAGLNDPRNCAGFIASRHADWPALAERPRNGRLDCSRIARTFGIRQPNWRGDLTEVLLPKEETVS